MWAAWLAILLAGQDLPVGAEARWVRPIGFSPGGALAYLQENPRCTCKAGRCVEPIPLCAYEQDPPAQCDRACRRVEGVVFDLRRDAVLQRAEPAQLDASAFGITRQQLTFVPLPHRFRGDRYTLELSRGCVEMADLEGSYDEVHTCAVDLVSETRGRKRVYSFRSRVLRGFQLTFQGALFSPHGSHVALLFQQGHAPFENEGPSRLFFVGANLEGGFVRAGPSPTK